MKNLALFDINDSDSDSNVITEPQLGGVALRSVDDQCELPQKRQTLEDTPCVAVRPLYFRFKHVAERIVAAVMVVLLSPLILFLIVLVRLTSSGPGIYRQERVGLNRQTFDVFKLRTMYSDAEADGQAKWCTKGDPRITPLGRFLRRTHLDELPQLWNVAIGDMSLTGPRPERPVICEKLKTQIPGYYQRTLVKPGITGLAQINLEPDTSIDDVRRKQCLDLHYIQTAGLWLDTRMVFATFLRMFGIRGARVMRWMGLCRRHVIETSGIPMPMADPARTVLPTSHGHIDDPAQDVESGRSAQSVGTPSNRRRHRAFRIDTRRAPK